LTFIYFSYNDRTSQQVPEVLSSLLHQLVLQIHELDELLENAYDAMFQDRHMPTSAKLLDLVCSYINKFDSCFIILDGLDECGEDARIKLFSTLEALYRKANRPCKMLLTSRPHIQPSFHLQDSVTLEITADETDLKQFIGSKLKDKADILPDERDFIVEKILDKCEGM
jgi:hypothetical protein